jgi:hypothetical protein
MPAMGWINDPSLGCGQVMPHLPSSGHGSSGAGPKGQHNANAFFPFLANSTPFYFLDRKTDKKLVK